MASFETRGHATRAVIRLPGGKKESRTFDTLREAQAWAASMEGHKSSGQHTRITSAGKTAADLFGAYWQQVASHRDSAKWDGLRLAKWGRDEVLGTARVADLSPADINAWIARRRADGVSPATINRELNLMSAAFTFGVKALRWLGENPCHGCARPERGVPRGRRLLTDLEIAAILVATGHDRDPELTTATARVGACFLLALETGMRSGEILRIERRDYLRDKRTVFVAARERGGRKGMQSGRAQISSARRVPLTDAAVAVLDALAARASAEDDAKLADLRDDQRDALWRAAVKRAAVADLHFHDAKHEACTRLARFLDVLELSHAVGTKDIRLLRDTYYVVDVESTAAKLPAALRPRKV